MQDENRNPLILDGYSVAVAALNDSFRKTMNNTLGRVVLTSSVHDMESHKKMRLIQEIQEQEVVTGGGNDPYNEHDFGSLEFEGDSFMWKIDYYDNDYKFGSDDPSNSKVTQRVLTIMYSSEY